MRINYNLSDKKGGRERKEHAIVIEAGVCRMSDDEVSFEFDR